jgi:hypothetical protein
MGEHEKPVDCRWCRSTHGRRFLCDSAAEVLKTSAERGLSGTLPTIVLDEPLPPMSPDPDADKLVGQLVFKAGVLPDPAGILHPVLVMTGMDAQGRILPSWMYCADDDSLRQGPPLMHSMVELAIDRANAQNGGRRRV